MPELLPSRLRLLLGLLAIITAVFIVAGAVSIPFYFETSTILYKFGQDRLLLRSGQVAGMTAGCLLLVQIVLSARVKFLDRIFGLNRLFKVHHLTGVIIACLIIMHPFLIFIPEERIAIPLQWRYWPEFVGLFLLLSIILTVVSSHWRVRLGLAFHRWWLFHRTGAMLTVAVFWVHILSVSDTFDQKIPQIIAFCAMGLCGLLFFWIRIRPLRNRRSSFAVSAIKPAGDEAVSLQIVPGTNKKMPVYLPGQFSFPTFLSTRISREEHPFTIASSPTKPDCLEFVVRTTGDWTAKLKNLKPDDNVLLDGPFGLFSHLRFPETKEFVMIAGGIGITPLLSMLRYMADHGDRRKITLIWSNRTRQHIIFPSEFQELEVQLKGLRIFHILTREPGSEKRRLDRDGLKKLLADCSLSSAVFVCGPDQMMIEVNHFLVCQGFPKRMILMERFSL